MNLVERFLSISNDLITCIYFFSSKITNFEMMQDFSLVAIAGPTTQGQPPFIWSLSDFDKNVSHIGHPNVWDFTDFIPKWNLT
jgi:hypothetical protein